MTTWRSRTSATGTDLTGAQVTETSDCLLLVQVGCSGLHPPGIVGFRSGVSICHLKRHSAPGKM